MLKLLRTLEDHDADYSALDRLVEHLKHEVDLCVARGGLPPIDAEFMIMRVGAQIMVRISVQTAPDPFISKIDRRTIRRIPMFSREAAAEAVAQASDALLAEL